MAANISTGSTGAVALDDAGHGYALSIAAAKHLANAMCYDDMIRVADLKTRSTRAARVRREVGVEDDTVLQASPNISTRASRSSAGRCRRGSAATSRQRPKLAAFLDRRINRGRHIRTDSMTGFAMLWVVGGLRRWRRSLLRHAGRDRASGALVRAGARPCRGRLRAWRRDPRMPAADQGLQRHPCPGPVEVRPGAVGTAAGQGPRRRRRLDPAACAKRR